MLLGYLRVESFVNKIVPQSFQTAYEIAATLKIFRVTNCRIEHLAITRIMTPCLNKLSFATSK